MSNGFRAVQISERVYWVGAIDNRIRDFHGYTTSRGSTYNAFLVMGEQPVLIDTVKAPFWDEMLARINSVIDPSKIRYIISNHAELDHSGALLAAIKVIQPERIFASKLGKSALQAHFHTNLEITEIINNQPLVLGDSRFRCLETRMLHWPDSMFTYLENDRILFSQDGFGMHLATYQLFADQNSRDILRYEALKYFANILLPYANLVPTFLDTLTHEQWPIDLLAPDHGPIWRTPEDIQWILQLWRQWSAQKPTNKSVIVYDTMWESTAKMARAVADGVQEQGGVACVMPLAAFQRSDIATELAEAGSLIVGSPTINNQLFPTLADLFCYLKGLKFKNLVGQAFGSFGWSGESVPLLQEEFHRMQVTLVGEPVKARYVPEPAVLEQCHALGQSITAALDEKR